MTSSTFHQPEGTLFNASGTDFDLNNYYYGKLLLYHTFVLLLLIYYTFLS